MIKNESRVFESLNRHLEKEKMSLTIICVGGFVLNHYGMRATMDVDAFYRTTKKLTAIIKAVGDEFNLNTAEELWLNNSVQNMNRTPPEAICETLYTFSNLKVLIPPLLYIAGMKLSSARGQDIEDVGSIIKKLGIRSPDALSEQLYAYGFAQTDESLLLEAFGVAYGMKWLEDYYIQHEDEINRRIRNREV